MLNRILAGAATAALGLFAAAPGVASAQTARPQSAHVVPTSVVPASHVMNLRQAYLRALPHVKNGKVAGIVYAKGKQAAAPKATGNSGCAEPDCALVYNGGPVQHNPKIYLLLWGKKWSSNSGERASAAFLKRFYSGLGAAGDTWSAITSQYTDGTGLPVFSGSVYQGTWQDTSKPPTGVSQSGLAAEANAFAVKHHLSGNKDVQIIIATQSGTCPQGFYAPNCKGGTGSYCAWHDISKTPYTNLPYLLDSGAGCGENFVNSGSAGVHDGWSVVGGHEYAETITDPGAGSGWYDASDSVSGGEIADKCAWGGQIWNDSDPSGNVTLSTGSFAMQSLWSNAANGCVMSASEDSVTTGNPGNQTTVRGTPVSVQMLASSSGGNTLAYVTSGLPAGVSVNVTTGLISGTPTQARIYRVKAAAGDTTGASGVASFAWNVTAPIKGYKGRCVADDKGYTANGTKIVIWQCDGGTPELWTVGANHSLRIFGKCLTVSGRGRAGSKVVLSSCKGHTSQKWTHRSNGEWVVAHHRLCLTDPHRGTRNGIQLIVAACHHTASQRWTKL